MNGVRHYYTFEKEVNTDGDNIFCTVVFEDDNSDINFLVHSDKTGTYQFQPSLIKVSNDGTTVTQKVWPFELTSESSLIAYKGMYSNGHFYIAAATTELSGHTYANKRAVIFTSSLSTDSAVTATVYSVTASSVTVGKSCVRYYKDTNDVFIQWQDTIVINSPSVEDSTIATSSTASPSLSQSCFPAKKTSIPTAKTYMVHSTADTIQYGLDWDTVEADCNDNAIVYSVDDTAITAFSMPIALSTGGQMTFYSTDDGHVGSSNLVVTATITFNVDSSSASFDYNLAATIQAYSSTLYTERVAIPETYTFNIAVDSEIQVKFAITCKDSNTSSACLASKVTYNYQIVVNTLTTSSTTPVSWNGSTGLLKIFSDDLSEVNTYNYKVIVSVDENLTGDTIGSEVYNLAITVQYDPADIYTITKQTIATSQTYQVTGTKIVFQYGVDCQDQLQSAACQTSKVTYTYAIDTTAGPISFSTTTGLLEIESSDFSHIGDHDYQITVNPKEVSSGSVFSVQVYQLRVTVQYDPSTDYTVTAKSIPTSATYNIGETALSQQFDVNCVLVSDGSTTCTSSDISFAYSINTTTGPVSFSSSGFFGATSSDLDDEGVYNYVVTVRATHVDSGIQFETVNYNYALTVSYNPDDIFSGTAKSLATSYTYYILAGQETVETYSMNCENTLSSSLCTADEVNYVLSIDNSITDSSSPISFSTSTGQLKVDSSSMGELQVYNLIVTVKMYDKNTQSHLIETINYNMALTITYRPQEVYIGTATQLNSITVAYETGDTQLDYEYSATCQDKTTSSVCDTGDVTIATSVSPVIGSSDTPASFTNPHFAFFTNDIAVEGQQDYTFTITLKEISSGTVFQTIVQTLRIDVTVPLYVIEAVPSIPTTLTYYLTRAQESVQFQVKCTNTDTNAECLTSEVTYNFGSSNVLLDASSQPISYTNGLLAVETSDMDDLGVNSLTMNVDAIEVSSGNTIKQIDYPFTLTIDYTPQEIYIGTPQQDATSATYVLGATAQTFSFSISCQNQDSGSACLSTEVYFQYQIDSTAGNVNFNTGSGVLSVSSSDVGDAGSYSYVITVKMLEDSTDTVIQTETLNFDLDITYNPQDVFQASEISSKLATYIYTIDGNEETVDTYVVSCQNTLISASCQASDVNYVYSIDSSAGFIDFNTATGQLKVDSDQVSDAQNIDIGITVKMYEGSVQSNLLQTLTYDLDLTLTYVPAVVYVGSKDNSIQNSLTYDVESSAVQIKYSLNCQQSIRANACLSSEVSYTYELSDDTGITSSSTPIAWDGTDTLTIQSTDPNDEGSLSYTITAKMFESSSGSLISTFTYNLHIQIDINPELYFQASKQSLSTSISYQESQTAQTITYGLDCEDTITSTPCTNSQVSYTFEVNDVSITSSSTPIKFDGTNLLTVYTTDASEKGTYSLVITAKMFGVTSGSLLQTKTYNLLVEVTYDVEDHITASKDTSIPETATLTVDQIAQNIDYNLICIDTVLNQACQASDYSIQVCIDDASVGTSTQPVALNSRRLTLYSTDFDHTFSSPFTYTITVKLIGTRSGTELDSVTYAMYLSVSADVQNHYYKQVHIIEEDVSFVIGSNPRQIQYGLTCKEDDGADCTNYSQTFTLTDSTGLTTSSVPIAWDSSSGLLTIDANSESQFGDYDYEIKVQIEEDDTGFTAEHTYYVYIDVEDFPTIDPGDSIPDDIDEPDTATNSTVPNDPASVIETTEETTEEEEEDTVASVEPPVFLETIQTFKTNTQQQSQIVLPEASDPNDHSFDYLVQISSGGGSSLPSFVTYDNSNGLLIVNPSKGDEGEYTFSFIVTKTVDGVVYQSNQNWKLEVEQVLGFEDLPEEDRIIVDPLLALQQIFLNATIEGPEPLTMKMINIDQYGYLTIEFSEPVYKVPLEAIQLSTKFQVALNKLGAPYEISWYFLSLQGNQLKARILYINPTVDDGVGSKKEQVKFLVNGNSLFVSEDGSKFLSNLQVQGQLIGQINPNSTQVVAAENLGKAAAGAAGGAIITVILLQVLIGGGLKMLWNLLSMMQIVSFAPLMATQMPGFVISFFGSLNFINIKLFLESQDISAQYASISLFQNWNKNFNVGAIALNILLSNMMIFYVAATLFVIFAIVAIILLRKEKFRNKLKGLAKKLRYGMPIQTFIQLYLVLLLAAGFSFVTYLYDYQGQVLGAVQTIGLIVVLFCAPFITAGFLAYKKQTKQLKKEVMKERFGVLYKDLRYRHMWKLMFIPIFMLRRLIFVLGIVWWHDEAEVQWASYFYIALIMTVYLCYHRPYKTKQGNFIAIFNESMIFLIACVMICLTQVTTEKETRDKIGWTIIIVFLSAALTNVFFMLKDKFLMVYNKIKGKENKKEKLESDESEQEEEDQPQGEAQVKRLDSDRAPLKIETSPPVETLEPPKLIEYEQDHGFKFKVIKSDNKLKKLETKLETKPTLLHDTLSLKPKTKRKQSNKSIAKNTQADQSSFKVTEANTNYQTTNQFIEDKISQNKLKQQLQKSLFLHYTESSPKKLQNAGTQQTKYSGIHAAKIQIFERTQDNLGAPRQSTFSQINPISTNSLSKISERPMLKFNSNINKAPGTVKKKVKTMKSQKNQKQAPLQEFGKRSNFLL